jgi:L-alanine-DL-glutamate epimerase-like enolase superfamily enzyme
MRITSIAVHQRELPVVGGEYAMGGNTVVSLDTTLVQVATDVGVVSWGETCPLGTRYQPHHARGARAAIAELAPALMGADPLRVLDAGRRMDEALAGHAYAKAPLEVALWDILARAHDTRLCDLLGGASGDTVPAYAVIGLEPPEAAAEHALALQAQGYRRIQLKVGGRGLDEDIAAVRAVDRALRPGVALVADANRAWSVPDAMLASAACRDVRMALEQPCASYEEMASLRGRLAHPVILDEIVESPEVAMRAIVEGVADGFGLKVSRVGGVGPMLAIRDMCRARRVGHTCDDAWGGDIAAATCVHIAATVEPSLLAGVWIAAPYMASTWTRTTASWPTRAASRCRPVPVLGSIRASGPGRTRSRSRGLSRGSHGELGGHVGDRLFERRRTMSACVGPPRRRWTGA